MDQCEEFPEFPEFPGCNVQNTVLQNQSNEMALTNYAAIMQWM